MNCSFPVWGKDKSYCIFHSEQVESKKKKFDEEFNKLLDSIREKEIYIYFIEGFIFPNNVKIKNFCPISRLAFLKCKFHGNFEINSCEFKSNFAFQENIVAGEMKISWSHFHKLFILSKNKIDGNLIYHINYSYGTMAIRKSEVKGFILILLNYFFGEIEIADVFVKKDWYIYGIDFSKTSRTRFRDLDFRNVYFFESKLIDIEFLDIKWRKFKNRYLICDEIALMKKELPPHHPIEKFESIKNKERIVESLYLQLCVNHDNFRLFDDSGKFYISAMEMKRLSKGNWLRKNLLSWEAWYKYISLYGESSKRAMYGIIIVIVLCSVIIFFSESKINHMSLMNVRFDHNTLFWFISSIFKSIIYNIYSLINPVEWSQKDTITIRTLITGFERLIIIFLSAFFLLALKRKFRRN